MDARRARPLLDAEEEGRRDQHGLERELYGFLVRIAALGGAVVERQESFDFLRLHGPPVRLGQERGQQPRGRLAWFEGRLARFHAEEAIVQSALLRRSLLLLLLYGDAI